MNLFMKNFWRRQFIGIFLGSLIFFLCGCGERKPVAVQTTDTAMGTVIRQSLYVTNGSTAAADEVMELLEALDQETLSWRLETSELWRINETAGQKEAAVITEEMAAILKSCQEISEKSGGAFDITIGQVARLWSIDTWAAGGEPRLPDEKAVAHAVDRAGYRRLSVNEREVCLPEGMQLDLGAVGKGIALSHIDSLLQQHEEVTGAVISVGGSILTYGTKPGGGSWRVGVANPLDTSASIGYLELDGGWCVSTSGDYERYIEIDGKRLHHILNPYTGFPAESGVHSVTILTRDGLLSDALSTACFVLGVEEGLALAEECGVEAVFVDFQGEISMTAQMEEYFHLSQ